jgi:hypothetical protein
MQIDVDLARSPSRKRRDRSSGHAILERLGQCIGVRKAAEHHLDSFAQLTIQRQQPLT